MMHFATPPSSKAGALDRNDPTPKYHQIRRNLEEQILLGKFPLGAQVPTEVQLCEMHGVSRITARKALEELKESGIIERTQGRGSFVCRLPEGRAFLEASVPTEIAILTNHTPQEIDSKVENWGSQIIRGMGSRLSEQGLHATLLPFHNGRKEGLGKIRARLDSLGPRLAGVLGFASPYISPLLDELDRRGIPWVTANPVSRQQTHNFVSADNFAGGWRVGREFAQLHYERSLYISTSIMFISNADRFFGFLQGWFEGGKALEKVQRLEANLSTGLGDEEAAGLIRMLTGKHRPRAVFCAGDILAAFVMKMCAQCGLSVPEDVAVVGGTGMMLSEHTTPPLTVLAQPMAEISHAAESMLVEMIQTKQLRLPGRYIASPLIRRASCPIGNMS